MISDRTRRGKLGQGCGEKRTLCEATQRKTSMPQRQRSFLWHMLKIAWVYHPLKDQGHTLPLILARPGITSWPYLDLVFQLQHCGTANFCCIKRLHLWNFTQHPQKTQAEDGFTFKLDLRFCEHSSCPGSFGDWECYPNDPQDRHGWAQLSFLMPFSSLPI